LDREFFQRVLSLGEEEDLISVFEKNVFKILSLIFLLIKGASFNFLRLSKKNEGVIFKDNYLTHRLKFRLIFYALFKGLKEIYFYL